MFKNLIKLHIVNKYICNTFNFETWNSIYYTHEWKGNAYQLSRKVRKMVMIKYYYEVALVLFWQGKLYEHLIFITQGCELQKMSCAMCNMDRLAPAPSTQLGGLKNCPNWKPNRARQFARHNQAFFLHQVTTQMTSSMSRKKHYETSRKLYYSM